MKKNYKIGVIGLILNGYQKGWYILIEDDFDNTGGHYIYYSPNKNFKGEGFDDWVEGKSGYLDEYWSDVVFDIDWNFDVKSK